MELNGIEWNGIGLNWIELDWIGLDWIGLDWTGLDWIEFHFISFHCYRQRSFMCLDFAMIPCFLAPLLTWIFLFHSAVMVSVQRVYSLTSVAHFNETLGSHEYIVAVDHLVR